MLRLFCLLPWLRAPRLWPTLRESHALGGSLGAQPSPFQVRLTPWEFCGGTEVPVIASDSTLLSSLPDDLMHDVAVWRVCGCGRGGRVCIHTREPVGRLLGCRGSAFAMSGKTMKYRQIGRYMREQQGMGKFDSVFCIPMARSLPPQ